MEDRNMEGSLVLRSTVSYRSSRLIAPQIAEVEPNSWEKSGEDIWTAANSTGTRSCTLTGPSNKFRASGGR